MNPLYFQIANVIDINFHDNLTYSRLIFETVKMLFSMPVFIIIIGTIYQHKFFNKIHLILKITLSILLIFLQFFISNQLRTYWNEKEKIGQEQLTTINQQVSIYAKNKKIDNEISVKISQDILLCDLFVLENNTIKCVSYMNYPTQKQVKDNLEILKKVESEKLTQ